MEKTLLLHWDTCIIQNTNFLSSHKSINHAKKIYAAYLHILTCDQTEHYIAWLFIQPRCGAHPGWEKTTPSCHSPLLSSRWLQAACHLPRGAVRLPFPRLWLVSLYKWQSTVWLQFAIHKFETAKLPESRRTSISCLQCTCGRGGRHHVYNITDSFRAHDFSDLAYDTS